MNRNWLPIETAPKDGTCVLLWVRGYCEVGQWDNDKYAKRPKPFWNADGPWGRIGMRAIPPTHWMPIPDPPMGVEVGE